MQVINNPPRDSWNLITNRPMEIQADLEPIVQKIINGVRQQGDQALIDYTEEFDGVRSLQLKFPVPVEEPPFSVDLKQAIETAYQNIQTFHRSQKEQTTWTETMPGVKCCRKSTPIEKVGMYIPGGSAPLFSTLLMLAVPARLAGCNQIIICTPPQADGSIHPALLYTAQLLEITELYAVGGAQAIAAMAFGTETIPKVYKIVGPGNQYVTMAKKLVNGDSVSIDFPAGPSEVAILADDLANPEFIAADLLSQAEHGPDSQVILATDSPDLIIRVTEALDRQLKTLPRKDIAKQALLQSKLLVFGELEEAMTFLNTYAPEHLIINVHNPHYWADRVINAGSVFLGPFTPESAGDYASGTNHTLPTNGNARMYAGVSLDTFLKKITFQEITREGLNRIGDTVEVMAAAEGLEAHKRAVSIRRKTTNAQT